MSASPDTVGGAVARELASGAMPGAAWWVGDAHGPRAHGAAGFAVVEPERVPATKDTPYDLASLTKPLATATLALLLEADRRLDLDATLGALFPVLRGTAFAGATLRDAATHRAGLRAWLPLYASGHDRDAYLDAIAASPWGTPGETLYSDLGYILLGFALEEVAGEPLDRLFDARIARPLGLASTGYAGRSARFAGAAATERGNAYERRLAGGAAASYRFRDAVIRGVVHDGNAWGLGGVAGHAGLFGTAAEVATLALAILDPAPLGAAASIFDPMFRAASPKPGARTFGFVRAGDSEAARGLLPDDAVGHSGFTGTSLWLHRPSGRVWVLLTNRVHPTVPATDFSPTRRAFHAAAAAS